MKELILFIFLTVFSSLRICAQTGISKGDFNKIINSAFNKLVSSSPSAGAIASFATIDPINASFNAKGTFPLQQSDKKFKNGKSFEQQLVADQGNISYLSFTLSGGLTDKSYAALFSNSSLNAGVDMQAQYNFKLCRPSYTWSGNEASDVALKKAQLLYTYHHAVSAIERNYSDSSYQRTRYLLSLQQNSDGEKLNKESDLLDLVQKSVDSLGIYFTGNNELLDNLQKQSKTVAAAKTALATISAQLDSVDMIHANSLLSYRTNKQLALQTTLRHDYDSLLLLLSFKRIQISWFTLLGGYSRTSYNSYDPSLQYSGQIIKTGIDAFMGGVAFNHLDQNKLKHHTFFLNVTLSRKQTTNLSRLTPISIDQTVKTVNAGGDTSRSIAKKYSVYTDPVTKYTTWNIAANLYYLFGKTLSGFHILPSVDVKSSYRTIYSGTLGYVIPFQNTVKDQPIVNAEFYIRFDDITNQINTVKRFWNRNEIGISFTIPFNIFN